MATVSWQVQELVYRVAVVLPQTKEILAQSDGSSHRLPTVTIPRWRRIAEHVTAEIKNQWNLQAVMIDSWAPLDDAPGFSILEGIDSDDLPKNHSLRPAPLDLISMDAHTIGLLQDVLAGAGRYRNPALGLGWIHECKRWLQANVRDHQIEFTGDIRQLNAGAGFALVRFGVSEGPAYWIKAVGKPNRHEAAITQALSRCAPTYLPPLVAVHQPWNAWAVEEVGSALTDSVDVETICLVASSLAKLQQETINHGVEFLHRGCGDQRLETLQSYLPEFLDSVVRLCSKSPIKGYGHDIDSIFLRMQYTLHVALEEMRRLDIPDTINNHDIKLENILFDGRKCALIDWCHAHWGNPFITFQHLHIYLSRRLPDLASPFQSAYARVWYDYLSESQVEKALMLSFVLAPYAYLCARGPAAVLSCATDTSSKQVFLNIVQRILIAGTHLARTRRQPHV